MSVKRITDLVFELPLPVTGYNQGEDNPFYGKKHSAEWLAAHKDRLFAKASAWKSGELDILREWYHAHEGQTVDIDALASKLGRTHAAVTLKASRMGLTCRRRVRGGVKQVPKWPDEASRRAAVGRATKAWQAEHGHPRGALGLRHTAETRAKISASQLNLVALGIHGGQHPVSDATRQKMSEHMQRRLTQGGNVYSRCKHGRREDLGGQFFRSSWEANYARYLNLLVKQGLVALWEYEAETFWFEGIKRGVRSYTPDFRVTRVDRTVYFAEVKGWMDDKSKTKIKRMGKYYPDIELQVVDAKVYRDIERKLGAAIPGWEGRVAA